MQTKLTLISANGRAVFLQLPVCSDGRVRISWADLRALLGIQRGEAIYGMRCGDRVYVR